MKHYNKNTNSKPKFPRRDVRTKNEKKMQTQRNKVKIKSVIISGPINELEAKRLEKI